MLYTTTHCPTLCAISLDDSRLMPQLKETHRLVDEPEGWAGSSDEAYSWVVEYHASLATEIARRTGKIPRLWLDLGADIYPTVDPPPPRIMGMPLDAREDGFDFSWYHSNPFYPKRMLLRALWRDSDPQWTNRIHPKWLSDKWVESPYAGTDFEELTRRAIMQIKFEPPTKGSTMPCPRCGDRLEYSHIDWKIVFVCTRPGCIEGKRNC